MIKEQLALIVEAALNKYLEGNDANLEIPNIEIEYASDYKFGDYACTIAMRLSKIFKKNPYEIACSIVEIINQSNDKSYFEKLEVAKPGFINMTLSTTFINDNIKEVLSSKEYKKNSVKNPQKIQVEYVSANPTGPLHIGHGRWAAIGDSLSRILSYVGHDVQREFYVNDAGVQIERLNASILAAKNNIPIPEDGYHGEYIKEVAQMDGVPKDILLDEQKELLKRFNCEFDNFASEAEIREHDGIKTAIELLDSHGYIYEKDNALWFKTTDFGDDKDRVLKKTDGSYTYFASDIAYHKTKIDRGFDFLINMLGADHHGYMLRISSAVKVLSDDKVKLHVILGQLVRLFRGKDPVKMSKRTGDMITLEEVIDEIGVDSTRYFLSMRSANTPLDFDLEIAKKHDNDNPVYYVQYAYARICNIFLKLKEKGMNFDENTNFDISLINDECTDKLAKMILRFSDECLLCASIYEVHPMVAYTYELAASFHRFYYNNIVLDDDEKVRTQRLLLSLATQNILGICFDIIGITKLQNMWVTTE